MAADLRQEGVHGREDLDLFVVGDIIGCIFDNEPNWKYGSEVKDVVFAGEKSSTYSRGMLKFIYQGNPGKEHIVMYRARIGNIDFRNKKIVINEDRSVTESFSSRSSSEYQSLKALLQEREMWVEGGQNGR